jgi:DNA-binding NarL/FixJ family response regulator
MWVALGEAEMTRVASRPDQAAWARVEAAADARPNVHLGAYARFREAEAHLASRGSREDATRILLQARVTARRLGARPLLEALEGLATRARLTLEAAPAATQVPEAGATPEALARYELTPRELEVLRLIVAGRTNRQIGDELFISESTAGVHVSRILAKFGVAGRVEAATIGARLGLAD